jgi:predicted Rossmann fold flavoprotein
MGSSGYAYQVAKRYTINVIPHRAGLVPLTFDAETSEKFIGLAGISQEVEVTTSNPYGGKKAKKSFREALLFTHKGLSGPAILQISSYWREGNEVIINFTPDVEILEHLKKYRESDPKLGVGTVLSYVLPKRLAVAITTDLGLVTKIADMSNKNLERIAKAVNACEVIPSGTEGYKTAEVALGGVDTKEISSKTFEANKVEGLYFIGECLDVTGHLGGFNFQWAWASGHAAGQYV